MAFFDGLVQFPEDPIFNLPILFAADQRPHKVNLGVGSYKDAEGLPFPIPAVTAAEKALLASKRDRDYLPIAGDPLFIQATKELIFGSEILKTLSPKMFTAQTVGGTSALRIGGEFLSQEISKTIFLPNPTWQNHKQTFNYSGMNAHFYQYYDDVACDIDFNGMCRSISEMPPGSTILLHACCHNPTGMDPSMEHWHKLSKLILQQKVIPFFDLAYQGFKESIDADAYPIRYFASEGHEMLVANTFSKTFGLYGERVGSLTVVTHSQDTATKGGSQIKQLIRGNYSNPPRHGAALIASILGSESLKNEWLKELANMRGRLKDMRHTLIAGLQSGGHGRDWNFLNRQNGFFSFCGLNEAQVHRLIKEYGIYMPANGRINVAGLNGHNINYVIEAILKVEL
ncbi:MAG: amino acid aminotransferase [Parachlamydiaceae bacterium]